ncbi:MAG TPA: helix-turn-helix domain-containing protein [Ktedonobacterales bacterium]|jgi:transcriptional regulator with XRE-family HTH domain
MGQGQGQKLEQAQEQELWQRLTLGQRLRHKRLARNWTQERLAETLETTAMTVRRWEHGAAIPQARFREQLCHVFDCSSEELFGPSLAASMVEGLTRGPLWTVPYLRTPHFTGRERLLDRLHRLIAVDQAADATRSVALIGLGGIGKTQIAIEYAYRHMLDYRAVFWLAADTAASMATSLRRIAEELGVHEHRAADQQELLVLLQRWLRAYDGWLLIVDNVADPELLLALMPPTFQGALLLTTQHQALGAPVESLAVPPLNHEEGVVLVLRRGRILPANGAQPMQPSALEAGRSAAHTLVGLVEGLPLALDQAGAYIEETGCGVTDYLDRYRLVRHQLLARRGTSAGDHPDSVAATILRAVEQARALHPASAELLRFCSFLHLEAIPEELLVMYLAQAQMDQISSPSGADPSELDLLLAVLRRFSLVMRSPETHTLRVHRLVQSVLRDQLDATAAQIWSKRVVRTVNAVFPTVSSDTLAQCERFLPHALACIPLIKQASCVLPGAIALLHKAGSYFLQCGHYREAKPLLMQAIALEEVRHGLDLPRTTYGY